MTPSDSAVWIAVGVAVVGAVAAVWHARVAQDAARSAKKASAEANGIQAAMLKLHRREADQREALARQTRWDVSVEETSKRYILIVECLGPAPARDVSILVDGAAADTWGAARELTRSPELMEVGTQMRFAYMRMDNMPAIREVAVSWVDVDGSRQQAKLAPRFIGRRDVR